MRHRLTWPQAHTDMVSATYGGPPEPNPGHAAWTPSPGTCWKLFLVQICTSYYFMPILISWGFLIWNTNSMWQCTKTLSVIGWLLHQLGNLSPQLLPRNKQGTIFSEKYDLHFKKKKKKEEYTVYSNSNRRHWQPHQDEQQAEDVTAAGPYRFWFLPGSNGGTESSTSGYKPQLTVIVIISGGFTNYNLKWIKAKETFLFSSVFQLLLKFTLWWVYDFRVRRFFICPWRGPSVSVWGLVGGFS